MSGGGTRSKQEFLTLAQKFGATSTISKPVTANDLVKIIEAVLQEAATENAKNTG